LYGSAAGLDGKSLFWVTALMRLSSPCHVETRRNNALSELHVSNSSPSSFVTLFLRLLKPRDVIPDWSELCSAIAMPLGWALENGFTTPRIMIDWSSQPIVSERLTAKSMERGSGGSSGQDRTCRGFVSAKDDSSVQSMSV